MAEVLNQEQVLINEDTLKIWADYMRYKLGEVWEPTAEGFTKYTPQELLNKLVELPFAKDAIPNSAKHITGDCTYRFANGGWDWLIKQCGEEIMTENLQSAEYMFYKTGVKKIPFDINCDLNRVVFLKNIFNDTRLEELPKLVARPSDMQSMFKDSRYLKEIPEDYFDNIDWSFLTNLTSSYTGNMNSMFAGCNGMRYIPVHKLKSNPRINGTYSYFYNGFANCYCLDELVDLPLPFTMAWTGDNFHLSFDNCLRLKRLTFALNEGQPCIMNWKSQVINLSVGLGFSNYKSDIINDYSNITADKEVKDDATYQALKNDKDWFTIKREYSRYNHDSAVETINSLPDTSAYLAANGGTNTIKFTGAAGSATDGGAINTLTEVEIAVAAAKGWTVSLI